MPFEGEHVLLAEPLLRRRTSLRKPSTLPPRPQLLNGAVNQPQAAPRNQPHHAANTTQAVPPPTQPPVPVRAITLKDYIVCVDKAVGKLVHGFEVKHLPFTRRGVLPIPRESFATFLEVQGRALQRLHATPHQAIIQMLDAVEATPLPQAGVGAATPTTPPTPATPAAPPAGHDGFLFFPALYGDLTRPAPGAPPTDTYATTRATGGRSLKRMFKQMLAAVAHCHRLGVAVQNIQPSSFAWTNERCTELKLTGLAWCKVVAPQFKEQHGCTTTPSVQQLTSEAAALFTADVLAVADVFRFLLRLRQQQQPLSKPPAAAMEWMVGLLRSMLVVPDGGGLLFNPDCEQTPPTAAELVESYWLFPGAGESDSDPQPHSTSYPGPDLGDRMHGQCPASGGWVPSCSDASLRQPSGATARTSIATGTVGASLTTPPSSNHTGRCDDDQLVPTFTPIPVGGTVGPESARKRGRGTSGEPEPEASSKRPSTR